MGAARLYGWRELRRRWRMFVALGVVAAVAGGLVLAAWAGARRTHTSIDRFVEGAHSPQLLGPIAQADEGEIGSQVDEGQGDVVPDEGRLIRARDHQLEIAHRQARRCRAEVDRRGGPRGS